MTMYFNSELEGEDAPQEETVFCWCGGINSRGDCSECNTFVAEPTHLAILLREQRESVEELNSCLASTSSFVRIVESELWRARVDGLERRIQREIFGIVLDLKEGN